MMRKTRKDRGRKLIENSVLVGDWVSWSPGTSETLGPAGRAIHDGHLLSGWGSFSGGRGSYGMLVVSLTPEEGWVKVIWRAPLPNITNFGLLALGPH
jgi:hypothetical protein